MTHPAPHPVARAESSAPARAGTHACPLLCLTYAYSGIAQFRQIMSGRAGVTCTAGTGLLPLCEQALGTWRAIEDRDGPVSALARSSVASMVGMMTSVVLAGSGAKRWCEVALGESRAAKAFLNVFPAAKFLCLHRNCLDVMRSGVLAHPWGMADSPFAPFAALHEGSAAVIAAYWAAHTEALLTFEADNPAACLRVRIEDLIANSAAATDGILAFWNAQDRDHAHSTPQTSPLVNQGPSTDGAAAANRTLQVPIARIPPRLRTEIDALSASLGYPGLGPPD
jgi:protein-tyrosine sulfotransferase